MQGLTAMQITSLIGRGKLPEPGRPRFLIKVLDTDQLVTAFDQLRVS